MPQKHATKCLKSSQHVINFGTKLRQTTESAAEIPINLPQKYRIKHHKNAESIAYVKKKQ